MKYDCALGHWAVRARAGRQSESKEGWEPEEAGKLRAVSSESRWYGCRGGNQLNLPKNRENILESGFSPSISSLTSSALRLFPLQQTFFDVVGFKLFKNDIWHFPRFPPSLLRFASPRFAGKGQILLLENGTVCLYIDICFLKATRLY